jgi:hypothetical protein
MNRPLVAAATAAAVLALGACTAAAPHASRPNAPSAAAEPSTAQLVDALPADVLRDGPVFGVNVEDPTEAAVAAAAAATSCRPGWTELFVSVAGGVDPARLAALPGVPVLSVEPWQSRATDPAWTLATTLDGSHDTQYAKIAATVRGYGRPVLIRFAHEMNGRWYPWGPTGGNTPGQYIAAWRHVVSIFDAAGATNALWIWSPNILRGAVKTPLAAFYPGDDVVDFAGLTGYGETDNDPAATYGTTMAQLATVTTRPIILTEVGVRPGPKKTRWITAFGPWLAAHPGVVGFIWSARPAGHGARYDWRYDDSPANLSAFRTSLGKGRVAC